MKLRLRVVLIWTIAATLFVWTLSSVSLRLAWGTIRQLDVSSIALLALVNVFALVVLTLRWWIILRGLGYKVGLLTTIAHRLAASAFSYFTPGPQFGGEPIQVLLLEKRQGALRESAVASVLLDRLLEAVVNFGFLGAAALVVVKETGLLRDAAWFLAALVGLPLFYLLLLGRGLKPIAKALEALATLRSTRGFKSRFGRLHRLVHDSEREAGRFCRDQTGYLFGALLASLAGIALLLAEYGLMAYLLGMPMTLHQLVMGLAAARLAFLLFLPAGLGVLEAGQVLILGAMGFAPDLGVSLSLVIRARDVLLGALGLWWGVHGLTVPPSRSE